MTNDKYVKHMNDLREKQIYASLHARWDLPEFLNVHNLKGEIIDVGCVDGSNSQPFMEVWQGKRIWLCGPSDDPGQMNRLVHRVKDYSHRATLLMKPCGEALAGFKDGHFDMVFLGPPCGMVDQDLWWPKIRSRGIMVSVNTWEDPALPKWIMDHRAERVKFLRCGAWMCFKP